jgi:hypothetical protein
MKITNDLSGMTIDSWTNADPEDVKRVTAADVTSLDGRSQWIWVWLEPDGDRALICFPQGDTFFDTEPPHPNPEACA